MEPKSLKADGFAEVKYINGLRNRVQCVVAAWERFCTLPPEEKEYLSIGGRTLDIGYKKRTDKGERTDTKELFHVTKNQVPALRDLVGPKTSTSATSFMAAIDILLLELQPLVMSFARNVEEEYSLPGFSSKVSRTRNNWTFRFLHYFPGAEGSVLAHPHIDRGGMTLHLYESETGGEYLGRDTVWRPWILSDKQTIIFPSMDLQYESKGALKALCHRVASIPETARNGRYALIAFIDFEMTHRYEDQGRRLQEYEPGFNYGMSHEEFAKFYVPRTT